MNDWQTEADEEKQQDEMKVEMLRRAAKDVSTGTETAAALAGAKETVEEEMHEKSQYALTDLDGDVKAQAIYYRLRDSDPYPY